MTTEIIDGYTISSDGKVWIIEGIDGVFYSLDAAINKIKQLKKQLETEQQEEEQNDYSGPSGPGM